MSAPGSVLVVGGGLTGLTAAWDLARAGVPVTLVEAGGQVGGKVRTEHADGLVIEHGPDSFVAYRPAVLRLLDDLGMADEVVGVRGPRTVGVRVDGRMRVLPEGMGMVLPTRMRPLATTRLLTPAHKARAALDLILPRRLPAGDTSIGALLRARLGNGVVDRLAEPLIGGIYASGVDDLSVDAVLPSLRAGERDHRSLILASLAQGRARHSPPAAGRGTGTPGPDPVVPRPETHACAPSPGHGPGASPFRTLRPGLACLPQRLAEQIQALGGHVRTSTRVVGIEPDGGGVVAGFDSGAVQSYAGVVLALGAPAMAALLAGPVPAAAAALRAIRHTSTTVVTLAYPVDRFVDVPDSHGWLEASPGPVSGVTISSNKWPDRAPEGIVLLRAFVPQRRGLLCAAPDREILDVVAAHVGRVLGAGGAPILARVTRWSGAMPVYGVGHLDRVAHVDAAVGQLHGWYAAGAALHGVGLPDCVADGRRVAREALAGLARSPGPG